jgi:hypothetical protein
MPSRQRKSPPSVSSVVGWLFCCGTRIQGRRHLVTAVLSLQSCTYRSRVTIKLDSAAILSYKVCSKNIRKHTHHTPHHTTHTHNTHTTHHTTPHTHTHTQTVLQALSISLCNKSDEQLAHVLSSADVAWRLMIIAKRDKWQLVNKTWSLVHSVAASRSLCWLACYLKSSVFFWTSHVLHCISFLELKKEWCLHLFLLRS